MREMGCESSASPSGKRSRDADDEVYLDNFHSHKRYLSEVMASSLNGLSVEESLPEHLMESPARSEGMCNPRDEIALQYSPMSEDFDDARYIENPVNMTMSQADSTPTSPVSPHWHQRPLSASSSTTPTTSYPSLGSNLTSVNCSPSRQRCSDSEGRLPSSPSDICHPADLRRAALLRSVQMRTQPLGSPSIESPSCLGNEPMQNIEAEEQSYSCMGSLVDERDYQIPQQEPSLFVQECSSVVMSGGELNHKNSCRVLDMSVKGEESGEGVERGTLISSRRSLLGGKSKSCVDFKSSGV